VEALDDPAPEPPLRPEVLDSLLQKVEWRRRRTRRLSVITLAAAAAILAVALVVGILPGIRGRGGDEPMASAVTMSKVAATPINATVTLTGFGWGTRIDMACTYGQWSGYVESTPSNLGMVVVGRDGSRTQVATWLGLSGATALPSGNTPLPVNQITSVELVSVDSGKVLLERRL